MSVWRNVPCTVMAEDCQGGAQFSVVTKTPIALREEGSAMSEVGMHKADCYGQTMPEQDDHFPKSTVTQRRTGTNIRGTLFQEYTSKGNL